MKMWSQGLGKNELVVDFRNYKVVRDETVDDTPETVIKGITNEPVTWEFQVRLCGEDLSGMMNVFFKPATLFFVLVNLKQIFIFFFQKIFNKKLFAEMEVK